MKSVVPLLQFHLTKGFGNAALCRLAHFCERHHKSIESIISLPSKTMSEILTISEQMACDILKNNSSAELLAQELYDNQVRTLWMLDRDYPQRLKQVLENEAPAILFAKGNIELLNSQRFSVGFCGSRKASDKGLKITAACSTQLANQHVCVVSGYASGVDMSAHRATLEAGGETIFVLVDGILNFKIKQELSGLLTSENYLALSQFPPGMTWLGHNAMRRNGTIVGLSDAMILVESGLTGGTFAAGEEALHRQQPLFVIDFANPDASAVANPYFIKQGGIRIRGKRNKHLEPNLAQLIKVVHEQRWRQSNSNGPNLFGVL